MLHLAVASQLLFVGCNLPACEVLGWARVQPHYDYFFDLNSVAEFGQRVATVIMYLSDGYQGAGVTPSRSDGR